MGTVEAKKQRYGCFDLYRKYIRAGMFDEAWLVLRLLRRNTSRLGLDDASWRVQCDLEDMGVTVIYNRNGYTATAHLRSI